eukprot:GEMP01023986.1.p1 GENE.GEMP01023986.1~~GEMP01023986.1.p1  ORF type:complete len:282 (+),score=52.39 GEMP01023986.1:218-1063(+)
MLFLGKMIFGGEIVNVFGKKLREEHLKRVKDYVDMWLPRARQGALLALFTLEWHFCAVFVEVHTWLSVVLCLIVASALIGQIMIVATKSVTAMKVLTYVILALYLVVITHPLLTLLTDTPMLSYQWCYKTGQSLRAERKCIAASSKDGGFISIIALMTAARMSYCLSIIFAIEWYVVHLVLSKELAAHGVRSSASDSEAPEARDNDINHRCPRDEAGRTNEKGHEDSYVRHARASTMGNEHRNQDVADVRATIEEAQKCQDVSRVEMTRENDKNNHAGSHV